MYLKKRRAQEGEKKPPLNGRYLYMYPHLSTLVESLAPSSSCV